MGSNEANHRTMVQRSVGVGLANVTVLLVCCKNQLSAMTSSSTSTRPRNRPASHENKLRNVCKHARDIRPG